MNCSQEEVTEEDDVSIEEPEADKPSTMLKYQNESSSYPHSMVIIPSGSDSQNQEEFSPAKKPLDSGEMLNIS